MTSADVYAHTMPSETGRTSPEAQRLRQASPEHATPRRRRAVTIAQVAAETGLSTATVSKVLNGKPDVSPSTRVLVEDVLVKSGYRKRGNGEPPPLIDIVFNDFDSPWATEIIRGAAAAAQAEGLTVAFTALSEGDERRIWFDHITSRGTRGIILLLSQLTERQKGELVARGLPFVVIDPTAEPGPEVSSVGATNWSGGLVATKHLIDLGHRRIGIVTGPPELLCSRARFDGYRAALERADLSVDDTLVRSGDFRVKAGYEEAKNPLQCAAAPDCYLRMQRPPRPWRLARRARGRTSGPGGPECRRLRRHPTERVEHSRADDGTPAADGDGRPSGTNSTGKRRRRGVAHSSRGIGDRPRHSREHSVP